MSVPVLIGFAGVLVAAVATGMLAGRCVRQPRVGLILWTAATLALTAALAAQSMGFARGFSPATFRAVQLFELLLAPLWLAWGLAELAWPSETARFGARLICAALTVVGGVILATDPLTGPPLRKSWPLASAYDQPFSHYALDVTQAVAVVIAAVSVGLAAARARNDRRWAGMLAATAAVGLAVLLTAGLRFSLPARSAYPLASMLAAVLVWFGATRIGDRPGRAGREREAGEVDGYGIPEVRYASATNGHGRPVDPAGLTDLREPSRRPGGPGRPGAPYGPNGPGESGAPRGPGEPTGRGDLVPRQQPAPPGPDRYRGGSGLYGPGPDGRALRPDVQRAGAATAAAAVAAGAGLAAAEAEAGGSGEAAGAPATAPARPYGRIVIFTLLEDRVADFDRLAEQTADEVRIREPGTLVFVIHLVPNAPLQRIFYEIYRDQAAFDGHESQPYMQRFVAERRSCVLATNVIELRLKYAKVAPLPGPQLAGEQLPGRSQGAQGPQRPQVLEPLPPGPDPRRPAAGRRYGGI
jgi:quinol monooxygenase YgiN